MASTEMVARYKPGHEVTVNAAAKIMAGRFVKLTADKTTGGTGGAYQGTHCAAGDRPFGVAQNESADPTDASFPAGSVDLLVNCVRRGAIARVTAGATLTAGAVVMSDANGKAIVYVATGSNVPAGQVCANAANGATAEIDLF